MSEQTAQRLWAQATLQCNLHTASGELSPDTHPRKWFFELPAHCHDAAHWQELMPRIFYDLNVTLRRREPNDHAYIAVGDFNIHLFKPNEILAWDGVSPTGLPWVTPDRQRVWEPAVCYFVDEFGRYDVMTAHDFTELLLYRMLEDNTIDAARFIDFLNKYYKEKEPAGGQRIYDDRETRKANLVVVRDNPHQFRKKPGQQPFTCGPLAPEDI